MAGKSTKKLPLEMNPNATNRLKKKIDENRSSDVQPKSDGPTMRQGNNPQVRQPPKMSTGGSPMRPKEKIREAFEEKTGKKTIRPVEQKVPNLVSRVASRGVDERSTTEFRKNLQNLPDKRADVIKESGSSPVKKYSEKAVLTKVKQKKQASSKQKIKKAFDAAAVMRERRAKAMANRDPSKNPNNVNLRGITRKKKK